MKIGAELREVASRARTTGWPFVMRAAARSLYDRLRPPWERLYVVETREVVGVDLPAGFTLRVVSDLEGLEATEATALTRSVGESSIPVFEMRIGRGAELHLLLLGGEVAATRFIVFGRVQPFQNVVLTPQDVMGMDLRVDPRFRNRRLASLFLSASIADLGRRGIDRVYAHVSAYNERSIRALEATGFHFLLCYRVRRGRYRYDRSNLR